MNGNSRNSRHDSWKGDSVVDGELAGEANLNLGAGSNGWIIGDVIIADIVLISDVSAVGGDFGATLGWGSGNGKLHVLGAINRSK